MGGGLTGPTQHDRAGEWAPGWRTLAASVIGSAHVTGGMPCQDACQVAFFTGPGGRQAVVLVVADGAGSATCAAEGAALACATFLEVVAPYLTEGRAVKDVTRLLAEDWVWEVGEAVRRQAAVAGRSVREYACTLVAAIVDDSALTALQVGDGAIVVADGEGYRPVFWPQRGEYANMTHFVTEEDALRRLEVTVLPEVPYEVALLTDGLQPLALTYEDRGAHVPFFAPMFAPLRAIPRAGEASELVEPLAEFLASRAISRRTDDDKTLVLITRRPPTPPPANLPSAPDSQPATQIVVVGHTGSKAEDTEVVPARPS